MKTTLAALLCAALTLSTTTALARTDVAKLEGAPVANVGEVEGAWCSMDDTWIILVELVIASPPKQSSVQLSGLYNNYDVGDASIDPHRNLVLIFAGNSFTLRKGGALLQGITNHAKGENNIRFARRKSQSCKTELRRPP